MQSKLKFKIRPPGTGRSFSKRHHAVLFFFPFLSRDDIENALTEAREHRLGRPNGATSDTCNWLAVHESSSWLAILTSTVTVRNGRSRNPS